MIDPKMLELSGYEDIPHLLHPVVTDPKKAAAALKWAVKEMETRYKLLSDIGVRDIDSYNQKIESNKDYDVLTDSLPFIVIIIDELADLMFVAPNEIKESITRLSQMARAAGIHLIVASQRPSADVVAGLIKANFPSRISFAVSSKVDSRIILDSSGAEELLGKGDMLLLRPPNNLVRVQGAIISDKEIEGISNFLKGQAPPNYNSEITKSYEEDAEMESLNYEKDVLYEQALDIVKQTKLASISMIQRRLKIGYNRAANIIEMMEREGIVGEQESAGKPRKVYL
jgi:S-DNA-T family DNA segregation ATPase FtsK/SpoIIIE